MAKNFIQVILILFLSFPVFVFGHSGRTDSNGGHYNRKTGVYHFHNGGSRAYKEPTPRPSYRERTYRRSIPSRIYKKPTVYRKPKIVTTYTKPKKQRKLHNVHVFGFVDGDSIKVILNGKEIDVRLYGIDCPEDGQAYSDEALSAIKYLLTKRKIQIRILDYDRYGRAVAMVYANNRNVNETMIKAGLAWVFLKYCKEDVCKEWRQHEKQAISLKRGLWKDPLPRPPWIWRKPQPQ